MRLGQQVPPLEQCVWLELVKPGIIPTPPKPVNTINAAQGPPRGSTFHRAAQHTALPQSDYPPRHPPKAVPRNQWHGVKHGRQGLHTSRSGPTECGQRMDPGDAIRHTTCETSKVKFCTEISVAHVPGEGLNTRSPRPRRPTCARTRCEIECAGSKIPLRSSTGTACEPVASSSSRTASGKPTAQSCTPQHT